MSDGESRYDPGWGFSCFTGELRNGPLRCAGLSEGAKRAQIQGVVKFSVVITKTGDVAELHLTSGNPVLISLEASIRTVVGGCCFGTQPEATVPRSLELLESRRSSSSWLHVGPHVIRAT